MKAASEIKAKPSRGGVRAAQDPSRVRRGTDTGTMPAAASIPVDRPLTKKQTDFVRIWAMGESITSAALRAGYNDGASIAYRMSKMPNILALKHKFELEFREASRITKRQVIDMHMEAFNMGKLLSEPSSMVAAAREIGKLCGYYEPKKVDVNLKVNGSVQLERMNKMSDAELLKIIELGTQQALEALEIAGDEDEDGHEGA